MKTTKKFYSVYQEFERPVRYGDLVEWRVDSIDTIPFATEAEARAYFDEYNTAKASWEVENACGNGALKIRGERRVHRVICEEWTTDEDGNLLDCLNYETIFEDIYPANA